MLKRHCINHSTQDEWRSKSILLYKQAIHRQDQIKVQFDYTYKGLRIAIGCNYHGAWPVHVHEFNYCLAGITVRMATFAFMCMHRSRSMIELCNCSKLLYSSSQAFICPDRHRGTRPLDSNPSSAPPEADREADVKRAYVVPAFGWDVEHLSRMEGALQGNCLWEERELL